MKVTNVSVKLAPESADRLKAFCTMTLDDEFVVRDLKVIEGTSGLFVAMPSRKLTDHCPKCGGKNHLRAKFCNDCGTKLGENRVSDEDAQGKLHADIAHPINSDCRNRLQDEILDSYREECRSAGREEDAREVDRELGDAPPAPEPPAAESPPPEPAAPEQSSTETPAPEPPAEAAAPAEPSAGEAPGTEPTPPEPAAPEKEGGESAPADESKEGTGGETQEDKGSIFGEGIL
jgi:stage V sporulation protein G